MKFINTWSLLLALTLYTSCAWAQKASPATTASSGFNAADFKGLKWRNIGPYRGGRSVAATGIPNEPMSYIAGYTGGGLWKTENGGASWSNISDGFFKTGTVGAIAVSEFDPNVIYVGMGEHAVRGVMTSPGEGMYKSEDAGKTWKHIGLPNSYHIARIQIHPKNPDVVYVAVQGALHGANKDRGVYKSTDGGKTWKLVLFVDENTGASEVSMDYHNPRILYASTWDHRRLPWFTRSGGPGSALYKSTDGGETWTKLTKGLPKDMGKTAIAVSRANPEVVYANIEADRKEAGVYRSDDGGESWRLTSKDPATISRAWYYIEIYPDPVNEDIVYVLNAPALRSMDGGKTFTALRTIGHGDTHDLWINPNNNKNMILADDGGAEITYNNGENWSTQNNQPTAQFYRVITDNRFPYYVYAGQQDNSTVAIPSRTSRAGIDMTDWYAVGGGESAFIAFDPNNPELIYAGSYQGNISVFNQTMRDAKDIMAYPTVGLAITPSTMKYRFNWNAPIVAQPQNPNIIYHGGNVVLRTKDAGITWEEISGDLTRNEKSKQIDGGGPYTNEGAGGEVYNTLAYMICSPHKAGVLWTGSDCGLVHVTQDDGKTWANVTPPNLGESLINSIEVSPHNPAAAFVCATKYKFNDFEPYVFYTSDFGKTWTKIINGIDKGDFVRVVREDKVKPGLLYAGAERGMYISVDNGKNWQKFQLNLPAVPITDLTISYSNDLVAATSGRAFWILDDLSALQQGVGKLADQPVVFKPKTTVRFDGGGRGRPSGALGENPMGGVVLDYYLPMDMDTANLTMEIVDASNRVIRTYSNQADKNFKRYEGGPTADPTFAAKKGVNRFNWDLRTEGVPGVEGVYVNGSYAGARVAPGDYKIRLITRKGTTEQTVKVVPDPRMNAPQEAYIEQQRLMEQANNNATEIHNSVNRMREVKKQLEILNASLAKDDAAKDLLALGKEAVKKIDEWEKQVIQTQHTNGQDVINFYNRINVEMLNLKGRIDAANPTVTAGAKTRMTDLVTEWGQQKAIMMQILDNDVMKFNQLYKEKAFPAISIPRPSKP